MGHRSNLATNRQAPRVELKAELMRQGITQKTLAQAIFGFGEPKVSLLITGKYFPTLHECFEIAAYLGVRPEDIFPAETKCFRGFSEYDNFFEETRHAGSPMRRTVVSPCCGPPAG